MRMYWQTATALILVAALMLFSSCDKKSMIEKISDTVVDVAIGAFEDTVTDPRVLTAYATGGVDAVKEVAPNIYFRYTKNRVTDLSLGDEAEKEAYKWLQKEWPTVALMVYREGDLGPEGLWIRLDTWAKSEGYPGASFNLFSKLTPEQIDYLVPRVRQAIIEEYTAVMAEADSKKDHEPRYYDWE